MERHLEARKKRTRGVMVIAFLIILIVAILLVFFGTVEQPKQQPPDDQLGFVSQDLAFNEKYELESCKA